MNCMNAFSSSHNPIRTINLYVNKMALADKLLLFLSCKSSCCYNKYNHGLYNNLFISLIFHRPRLCIWGISTNKACLIIFYTYSFQDKHINLEKCITILNITIFALWYFEYFNNFIIQFNKWRSTNDMNSFSILKPI